MMSRRHRELLQKLQYPEDVHLESPAESDQVDLEILKAELYQILNAMPRAVPSETTIHWPTQETGQIISALKRHVRAKNTRIVPTKISAKLVDAILAKKDFRTSEIRNIGELRFEILQEALIRIRG